jgi:asparagine synthase (glutamine-hydrolysing)
MSGIAGACLSHAEREASLAARLDGLLRALEHRAGRRPDVTRSPAMHRCDAQCALGAQENPEVAESVCESQPLIHPETRCTLVWDGRLDNRAELLRALGVAHPDTSDAELVLLGYLAWQENLAARLLGDFAFAVWDPRIRSLFAARDPLGVRPFFFFSDAHRFLFATEFRALLRLPEVPRELDELTISEYLLWWTGFPQPERTFYGHIRRLPPAHWLRWSARGIELHRYWDLDPHRRLLYRRHGEYVEKFHALLTEAVRARTRSNAPVGVFLSGGLDSSAVGTLTARFAHSHGKPRAYSLQLPDENDESQTAERVARQAGLMFHRFPMPVRSFVQDLDSYVRFQQMPFIDVGWWNERGLLEHAAGDGVRVVLTGDGGDELFNYPPAYAADLVRTLRLGRLAREVVPFCRYHGCTLAHLARAASPYLAPPGLAHARRYLRWRQPPAWFNPDFARRTEVLRRLRSPRGPRLFDSCSANEDYYAWTRGRRILVDERRELDAAHHGIAYRYPYYDRRLLEFMFAVPWHEKVLQGRVKSFLREAPGLLPEPLRRLERKPNYLPYSRSILARQDWSALRGLFAVPPPQAAAYVDVTYARTLAENYLRLPRPREYNSFWGLACFFLWLKGCS